MASSRLFTATTDGLITVPDEGAISVLRPAAGYDLSPLPMDRVTITQGFRPDADYWAASGAAVAAPPAAPSMSIVCIPRSKRLARAMVAEAAARGGTVVVDGQKTDGIDGLFRDIRKRIGDLPSVTKAHGRLFALEATPETFADWAVAGPEKGSDGFYRQAGIFSEDRVDTGSALLAETLPASLGPRVADLGAGWGFLSTVILSRKGVEALDLIEAEAAALDCARLNVTDSRAAFHWADARSHAPAEPYDTIVTNPPFHTSRRADTALGQDFVAAAARMLTAQGALWLVANRHLPYERALNDAFTEVTEITGTPAFKIFKATRPVRAQSRTRRR